MGNLRLGDWAIDIEGLPVIGTVGSATIAGDVYSTIIMPDSKEWLSQGLEWAGGGVAPPATGYGRLYPQSDKATIAGLLADGWRIPTATDVNGLASALSGIYGSDGGGAMKTPGTAEWDSPNTGATNATGFSALPSGYWAGGSYWNVGVEYVFWLSGVDAVAGVDYSTAVFTGAGTTIAPSFYRSIRLVRDVLVIPAVRASGTHDIVIDGNGAAESLADLRQRVDIRLRTFAGEHWLNPELGVPWFRDFLTKAPDLAVCRQILWDIILGVKGIQAIESLTVALDRPARKMIISFRVRGVDKLQNGTVVVVESVAEVPFFVIGDTGEFVTGSEGSLLFGR